MSEKETLNLILQELREIKESLISNTEKIEKLSKEVSNLDNRLSLHIGFIDTTYNTLKTPLYFIKKRVEGIMQLYHQNDDNLII